MTKQKKLPMSNERKKLLFLAGLGVFLVIVVVWNTAPSSTKAPPPPTNTKGRVRNSDLPKVPPAGEKPDEGADNVQVAETYGPVEPLPPFAVPAAGDLRVARNIFAYPPPPPPPRPKAEIINQPPPPPIPIGTVSPSSVIAGSSRPLTITLTGNLIPVDAKVFWNGQPLDTQVLGRTSVRATVPPGAYSSPRPVVITVRSASQPDRLFSREIKEFQLVPSPEPSETFVFTGRVGNQAVLSLKDDKRPKLVRVGDTVNGAVPWKVLAINDKQIELLDTRNEIRKNLPLAAKGAR